jgi:hypothetical protein
LFQTYGGYIECEGDRDYDYLVVPDYAMRDDRAPASWIAECVKENRLLNLRQWLADRKWVEVDTKPTGGRVEQASNSNPEEPGPILLESHQYPPGGYEEFQTMKHRVKGQKILEAMENFDWAKGRHNDFYADYKSQVSPSCLYHRPFDRFLHDTL